MVAITSSRREIHTESGREDRRIDGKGLSWQRASKSCAADPLRLALDTRACALVVEIPSTSSGHSPREWLDGARHEWLGVARHEWLDLARHEQAKRVEWLPDVDSNHD
jgi:hypothetical protein